MAEKTGHLPQSSRALRIALYQFATDHPANEDLAPEAVKKAQAWLRSQVQPENIGFRLHEAGLDLSLIFGRLKAIIESPDTKPSDVMRAIEMARSFIEETVAGFPDAREYVRRVTNSGTDSPEHSEEEDEIDDPLVDNLRLVPLKKKG